MKFILFLLICLSNVVVASDEYIPLDDFDENSTKQWPEYFRNNISPLTDGDNGIDENGNTFLMRMCCYGDYAELQNFLEEDDTIKDTINESNRFGDTVLSLMCEYGSVDSVRLLLENGADVSVRNGPGHSPLMLACAKGYLEKVKLLLDNNAEINETIQDDEKDCELTPLFLACSVTLNLKRFDLIRCLIDHGADVNLGQIRYRSYRLNLLASCIRIHYRYPLLIELLLNNNASTDEAFISRRTGNKVDLYRAVNRFLNWSSCYRGSIISTLRRNGAIRTQPKEDCCIIL